MGKIKLSAIKPNPDNPRIIRDDKFQKLKTSIEKFPKMMSLRPIIVDANMIVLGGNMRLRALQDLGYKEIPSEWVKKADELTEDEKQEFIIKDNVGFGEWQWDELANKWGAEKLNDWGLNVPEFATQVDYSILDDEDVSGQISEMASGVKKAIQIEFESEHYEDAFALVKFWRDRKAYVGGMIMEYLKTEKEKI